MRSRHFLENSVRWGPIVKKYRSLKEAPADDGAAKGSGGQGKGEGGGSGGDQAANSTTIPSRSRTTLRTDSVMPSN